MEFLVANPWVFEIAVMAIGAAFTIFKGTDMYQKYIDKRYEKAIEAVAAGVNEVYYTYVKELKHSSDDGTLTEEEKVKARELAKKAAIEFGKTKGVNVIKEIGDEYMDLWIERQIQNAKK